MRNGSTPMENGELPERARRILDAALDADDPSDADRARIDAAFAGRLRALGIAAPTSIAATTGADALRASLRGPAHAAPSAGGAGVASKIALALVGAGIVALGLGRLSQPSASKPPQSVPSTAAAAPALPVPNAPAVTAAAPAMREAPPEQHAVVQQSAKVAHRTRTRSRGTARDKALLAGPSLDTLGDEVGLLETASAALRDGRFAEALRALDAHESRYATGALREERTGLRVLALCGAGDYAAGIAARRTFLRMAPQSVLARKVAQACAPGTASEPQKLDDAAD
jgi:hypothetical protein